MDEFRRDLWIYIWDCGLDMRNNIREYYSDLRDYDVEKNGDLVIYNIAYRISRMTGSRLPDHLHSRLLLAGSNEFIRSYIKLCDSFGL